MFNILTKILLLPLPTSITRKLYSLRSIHQVYDNWLGVLRVYLFGGQTNTLLDNLQGGKLHVEVSKENIGRLISFSNVLVKLWDLGYEIRTDVTLRKIIKTLTPNPNKEESNLLWALRVSTEYITRFGSFNDNYSVVTDVNGVNWAIRKTSVVSYQSDLLFGPLIRYYQEPEENKWLLKALQKGSIFVDVGANVGGHSIRACKLGAKVIAVEPINENCNVLRLNFELNQLSNFHILNIAAGNREEVRPIYLGTSPTGSSLTQSKEKEGKRIVEVKPLDLVIPKLIGTQWVDLLKVDVEGFEIEVLKGAANLLKRTRYIIVEVIPITDSKISEIVNLLKPLGFEIIDKVCRLSLYCDLFLRKSISKN